MPKFSENYVRSVAVRHTTDDSWHSNYIEFILVDSSVIKCYRYGEVKFAINNSDRKTLDCIIQLDIN